SLAVSVIVPLYNEEENVPILQSELCAALKNFTYEIIFVDDGSTDHTVERIESGTNLRVIRFEKNAGQSAAIYAGLKEARCVTVLVPFKGMHRFIPELVKGTGYLLVEIPVNHRPRRFGQSKYGLGNRALRATIDMFGVRWLLSRRLTHKVREP